MIPLIAGPVSFKRLLGGRSHCFQGFEEAVVQSKEARFISFREVDQAEAPSLFVVSDPVTEHGLGVFEKDEPGFASRSPFAVMNVSFRGSMRDVRRLTRWRLERCH